MWVGGWGWGWGAAVCLHGVPCVCVGLCALAFIAVEECPCVVRTVTTVYLVVCTVPEPCVSARKKKCEECGGM